MRGFWSVLDLAYLGPRKGGTSPKLSLDSQGGIRRWSDAAGDFHPPEFATIRALQPGLVLLNYHDEHISATANLYGHGTTSEGFQYSEEKLNKLIADLRAVGVPMIGVYGTQLEQPQSHQVLRQDDEARPTRTDSRGREHPQPDAPSHTLRSATTNRLRKCHWPSYPSLQSSVTGPAAARPLCSRSEMLPHQTS